MPSPSGERAFFQVTTYTFGAGTKHELCLIDLETNASSIVNTSSSIHDIAWIPGSIDDLAWLEENAEGLTCLHIRQEDGTSYIATKFAARIRGMQLKELDIGHLVMAARGMADSHGNLSDLPDTPRTQTVGILIPFQETG